MSEENIIDEDELDGLLDEAKGESTGKVPIVKETEVELELEPESVEETIELEDIVDKPEKQRKESEEEELDLSEIVLDVSEATKESIEKLEREKQEKPIQAIQPIISQNGLVAPVCSVQESVRIFKEFEKAKKKILTSKDIVWFGDDGRPCEDGYGSPHIKRSGWRKLARFFGLSWDIISISHAIPMQNGGYMYKTKVKIWHPAGASVVAEGIVTSKDPFFTKGGRKEANEEDVIMKSETVAINRGIDDILGGGEVSAAELE